MWNEEYHFVGAADQNKPFFIHIAGITYPDPKYSIYRKNANITNIEYVIGGSGTVSSAGQTVHPSAGQVYILRRGEEHRYFCDAKAPFTKLWMNVSGELVDAMLDGYRLDGILFDGTGTRSCFERIIALCREKLPPDKIDEQGAIIFHELLSRLYRNRLATDSDISPEARVLRDYIDSHLSERITIDELAALIYKSKSQTLRIFARELKTTPYEYLQGARMTLAKSLLSSTNLPIKQIAYSSGFADEHYFSFTFKKRCGVTPSEYRNGIL